MPKEPDKTNIILEEMRSNFRLSFEGQVALKEEIKRVNDRLTASDKKHDLTAKVLSEQIKEVRHDLTGQIKEVRHDLSGKIKEVRHDLTGQIKEVRDDLTGQVKEVRHDLTGQIKEVRHDLSGQIQEVKKGLNEVKIELKEVHNKVDHLDQKLDSHINQPAHA